jgi:acetyl esterase/lipase
VLRPSGEILARDLRAAGTPTTLLTVDGATHGHLNIINLPSAIAAIDDLATFLRRPFTAPGRPSQPTSL